MKYWNAVKLAGDDGICIQPHVIPLGMAWRMVESTDAEVVENITWSAVSAQTHLRLTDSELARLESQPSVNKLKFLVEELGYKGILLIVTSRQIGESGYCRYVEGYHYLANPDWSEVGTELGKLVDRVLASWREAG